jgi:hypothetical protein
MRYYKVNVSARPYVASGGEQQQYFASRADAIACADAIREYFYGDVLEDTTLSGTMVEFILCRDLTIATRCSVYAFAITDDSVSAADLKDYIEEAAREVEGLEAARVDVIEYDKDKDLYAAYDLTPNGHILVHFDYLAVP